MRYRYIKQWYCEKTRRKLPYNAIRFSKQNITHENQLKLLKKLKGIWKKRLKIRNMKRFMWEIWR